MFGFEQLQWIGVDSDLLGIAYHLAAIGERTDNQRQWFWCQIGMRPFILYIKFSLWNCKRNSYHHGRNPNPALQYLLPQRISFRKNTPHITKK